MEISEEQEDRIFEVLDNMAFDLLSKNEYKHILERIFRKESGIWYALFDLDWNDKQAETVYSILESNGISKHEIVVTWLPRPKCSDLGPYSILFFYCDELQWNTIAIFNRSTLNNYCGSQKLDSG